MRHMTTSTRLQLQPQAVAARAGQQKRPGAAAWQLQREGTAVKSRCSQQSLGSSKAVIREAIVARAASGQPDQGPGCAIAAATAVQEQQEGQGQPDRWLLESQTSTGVRWGSNAAARCIGHQQLGIWILD
ncbi:hypothetical protein Acr_00g0085610 [Actinidia rufa]|uniref:Uncharacterized protein n=1 Tax=Actinidia rufa TaxID=165716 RepID=A0A7J0DWQ4_9ERIC|nr:hypothetical protein Acr_00g0085610 [Actinidia rufa]